MIQSCRPDPKRGLLTDCAGSNGRFIRAGSGTGWCASKRVCVVRVMIEQLKDGRSEVQNDAPHRFRSEKTLELPGNNNRLITWFWKFSARQIR